MFFVQQHKRKTMDHRQKLGQIEMKPQNRPKIGGARQKNEQLQQDFSTGQPFFSDTEMRNGKHSVGNFKLDLREINEKLNEVFKKLNCAAKLNIALDFSERWTKINIDSFKLMRTTRSLKNF